jgi:putative ABC transport system permease protein
MFLRMVGESFLRNPRRKLLAAAALAAAMAVTTAALSLVLDVGDRLSREFRSLGANLLVTPQSDSLPLEIGGVDYRPVDQGAYLNESDLSKLKTIFWRNNIIGFTPFLDVPADVSLSSASATTAMPSPVHTTLIGTWYDHPLPIPDSSTFRTGLRTTHPYWKIDGRWFADSANECVLGSALASQLGLSSASINSTLDLHVSSSATASAAAPAATASPANGTGDQPMCQLTGILTTGDSEDHALLLPLSRAQLLSSRPGQVRRLFVSAMTKPEDSFSRRNPDAMTPADFDRWYCSPYISSIARQIQQVLPNTDVRAIRRVADTEGRVLTRLSSLLWLVTLAAMAAAALAVAATSAASVIERRSEIGLMKALGGANTLVNGIFLAEQLALALSGALLGFLLGAILAHFLGGSVFGVPASFRLVLLPIILGTAALVAILGSFIPLRRAARFEPASILRGE